MKIRASGMMENTGESGRRAEGRVPLLVSQGSMDAEKTQPFVCA